MEIPPMVLKKITDELQILQSCADEMRGKWEYQDGEKKVAGYHWTLDNNKRIEENYKKHLRTYLELKELLRIYEYKTTN